MSRIKVLAASVLFLLAFSAFGRDFRNLNVEQGLSNYTAASFCQDSLGRIWMATKGGVNRFDGYEVAVFRHDADDSLSLQSNLVNYMYCDGGGSVWACTAGGIAVYDPCRADFRAMDIPEVKSSEKILQISPVRYLVCTRNLTMIYDVSTGLAEEFRPDGEAIVVYDAFVEGKYLVVSTKARTAQVFLLAEDGIVQSGIPPLEFPAYADCLVPLGSLRFYAAVSNEGLWTCNFQAGRAAKVDVAALPDPKIDAACFDSDGRLWLCTKGGICIYNPSDGSSDVCSVDFTSHVPIESKAVRAAFLDRTGNMWTGSSYTGASYSPAGESQFETVRANIVRSVFFDAGTLWVGTRYNGLFRLNPGGGRMVHCADVSHILSMAAAGGKLYLASFGGGLFEYDPSCGSVRPVCRRKDINSVVRTGDGRLWLGCLGGLCLFDPSTLKVRKVRIKDTESSLRISTLMTDRSGDLWIGAKESLRRFRVLPGCKLEAYELPQVEGVLRTQTLHETADGTLWIGTSDGMLRFSGGVLSRMPAGTGLRTSVIDGIESDARGVLWVTTDKGLCRYDPSSGESRYFYEEDGLQGDQFTSGAICRLPDGRICVGGLYGLSLFAPAEVSLRSREVFPPFISGLKIRNEEVVPGGSVIDREMPLCAHIDLQHNQDAVTLRYTCPDYASKGHNRFAYILEGFDKDWTFTSAREATYTNIPAGRYRFRVRAANSSGVWAQQEALLGIRVRPVWYRSTLAYCIYGALLLALGVWMLLRFLRRYRIRGEEEMNRMRQKYEEDFRRVRLSSYTREGVHLSSAEEEFMLKVLGHIEENLDNQEFSVADLAQKMCMSRSSFHMKMKDVCRMPAVELVRRLRIEQACRLIRETEMSVGDIAENVGFASAAYFCACFKKELGMTPGEYAGRQRL